MLEQLGECMYGGGSSNVQQAGEIRSMFFTSLLFVQWKVGNQCVLISQLCMIIEV